MADKQRVVNSPPSGIFPTLQNLVNFTTLKVTIVNSHFHDTLDMSLPSDPVLLKGINPEKGVEAYLVQEVPLTLVGRTYKWDLYVAPVEDQLLLGLDFMIHLILIS